MRWTRYYQCIVNKDATDLRFPNFSDVRFPDSLTYAYSDCNNNGCQNSKSKSDATDNSEIENKVQQNPLKINLNVLKISESGAY